MGTARYSPQTYIAIAHPDNNMSSICISEADDGFGQFPAQFPLVSTPALNFERLRLKLACRTGLELIQNRLNAWQIHSVSNTTRNLSRLCTVGADYACVEIPRIQRERGNRSQAETECCVRKRDRLRRFRYRCVSFAQTVSPSFVMPPWGA